MDSICTRNVFAPALLGLFVLSAGCASQSASSKQSADSEKNRQSAQTDEGITDCAKLDSEAGESDEVTSSDSSPPFRATGPVATVDDHEISADYFHDEIGERPGLRRVPPRMAGQVKQKLVQKTVDQYLLQKSLDSASAAATRSEIDEEFDRVRSQFPNQGAYRTFLERRGLTEASMREKICRDLRIRKHIEAEYDVAVSDDDVESHYESNREQFGEPEQVKASHILIEAREGASDEELADAEERAKELAGKAKNSKEDFAELAREHSEGPSAKNGGDLGYFSRDRMVPAFSDAAFSAEPGSIVGPVRTRFGFHVIKVHDKKEAQSKSLEDVRASIKRSLQQKRLRGALEKHLATLRDRHSIDYHFDNVEVPEREQPSKKQLPDEMKKKLKKKLEQQRRREIEKEKGGEPEEEPSETETEEPSESETDSPSDSEEGSEAESSTEDQS